ncbi:conjugal transfer protein TraN [Escherichia coli]
MDAAPAAQVRIQRAEPGGSSAVLSPVRRKFCSEVLAAGYSNCCKDNGWGTRYRAWPNAAVMPASPAKASSNKLTVSVGEFCSKKVRGVCLEKKRSYWSV